MFVFAKNTHSRSLILLMICFISFLSMGNSCGHGHPHWFVNEDQEISPLSFTPENPIHSYRVTITGSDIDYSEGHFTVFLSSESQQSNSIVSLSLYEEGHTEYPIDFDQLVYQRPDPSHEFESNPDWVEASISYMNLWKDCSDTSSCSTTLIVRAEFEGETSLDTSMLFSASVSDEGEQSPADFELTISVEEITQ